MTASGGHGGWSSESTELLWLIVASQRVHRERRKRERECRLTERDRFRGSLSAYSLHDMSVFSANSFAALVSLDPSAAPHPLPRGAVARQQRREVDRRLVPTRATLARLDSLGEGQLLDEHPLTMLFSRLAGRRRRLHAAAGAEGRPGACPSCCPRSRQGSAAAAQQQRPPPRQPQGR